MNKDSIMTDFMESFYELNRCMNMYENLPHTYGTDDMLYMAEAHLVKEISELDNCTATDLAVRTGKTKSAISQLVNKLIKKSIVYRKQSERGGNEYDLFLTDKGRQIAEYHEELDKTGYRMILDALGGLTDDEMRFCIKVNQAVAAQNIQAIRNRTAN